MTDYHDILSDKRLLTQALESIQLSEKQREDMAMLHGAVRGVPVERDEGLRVRGDSVYSSSRIGANLSRYFEGVGPTDKMLWVGQLRKTSTGNEFWVMRPEMRSAMEAAGIV